MISLDHVTADLPVKTRPMFGAADEHYALFRVGPAAVPFIPLFGSSEPGEEEFGLGDVEVTLRRDPYVPPAELRSLKRPALGAYLGDRAGEAEAEFGRPAKCRLVRLEQKRHATSGRLGLGLELQPLHYEDYITANAFLDTPLGEGPGEETLRTLYTLGRAGEKPDPSWIELSNICGVGVVYLTRDDELIPARRSASVAVYPGIVGFTSSGSCDWGDFASPHTDEGLFRAAVREVEEELGDSVAPGDLSLFAMGIDAEQFYFQFCFLYRSVRTAAEIEQLHQSAQDRHEQTLFRVDFRRPEPAVGLVGSRQIEPAAEAAVLLLAMKRWGSARIGGMVAKYHREVPPKTVAVRRDMMG